MKKIFYWLPRVLSVLFIAFVSLLALDVLGEPQWPLALLIHLIPSFILIIMMVIAWKYERIGGIIFIGVGIIFSVYSRFRSLIIVIPIIILGVLFLVSDQY